jgi:hypothetical protein
MENQNILEASKLETLSSKYQTVKSRDVAAILETKGFILDDVVTIKTRRKERQGKQKHRMIFSNPELLASNHNDGKLQLLVTNSYDGTCSVTFQLGFFRFVCSNGLVVGTSFETIRVRHSGIDIKEKIDRAIVEVAAQAKRLNDLILGMKNKALTGEQVNKLKLDAIKLRTDKEVKNVEISILRNEDQGNDLFTVFNVVQEAVIRGNARLTIASEDKNKSDKIVKLRAIKGIDSTTQVNKELFNIVENLLAA